MGQWSKNGVGDSFSIIAKIEEFVTGIRPIKEVKYSINKTFKYTKIDIENVMLTNFQYDLKLEEFAKLSGRSLSVFKRDFNKLFNTTPYKWLKSKRLEYAKTLLLESELNINQIYFESGFINVSHFIESFKAAYKLSPYKFKTNFLNE